MSDRTFTVTGMTCSHCVSSVKEEVAAVDGVDAVDVELDGGRLTVSGSAFTDQAIAHAVEEAGYELTV